MKMKWLLPFLAAIVMAGCTKVQDPEFRRVEKFRLKNFGLEKVTIGFKVTYYNPNNFGVTVKEAEADVFMDTTYLGKFVQESNVGVNKKADFSVPFTGEISLQTALKLNLQELSSRPVTLKADGSVKVGKAGIFVSKPVHYEGKHTLDDIKL